GRPLVDLGRAVLLAAVLPDGAHELLARTPARRPAAAALPRRQPPPPSAVCAARVPPRRWTRPARRDLRRGPLRPPPGDGRVRRLGDRAEERPVGLLLPARAARLPAAHRHRAFGP